MRHVVLDADFGRGERFAAMRARGGRLHYLAVVPRLPDAAEIADAALRAAWPLDVPGFHRVVLDDDITMDLLIGGMDAVLPQVRARVDAFYLPPGTAPAVARSLAKLAVQGATLHARDADEALAWALTAAGFACKLAGDTQDIDAVYRSVRRPEVGGAPARAPHLRAGSAPGHPNVPREPERRAVVIGAGLAGSAAAQRLCAQGWQVTLIERHAQPAQEASGNLAGIVMPLLSKDDNIPTRLSRAAYLFALREWRRLGGIGKAFDGADCGVLQLARDARHAKVQQDVVAMWGYPKEYAQWLDAEQASKAMGVATPHGGWLFEHGGWARPASLCEAMLKACGQRLTRVFNAEAAELRRVDDEWQVRGADGVVIAQAPTVILASGASAAKLSQAAELPLFKLRGQVTHLAARAPVLPLVVCREAYVTPPSNGIVCAGATYDNDDDPNLRIDSQLENLARLAEIVPTDEVAALAHTAPLAGRVGFRCAAPDRLPLAGALPDYPAAGRLEHLDDVPRHAGLYSLLGYASRGLIWAPLMAELLVSQLEHTPPPLEAALVDALDPGRFLLKQRRREQ